MTMSEISREQLIEEFERACQLPSTQKHVVFPLGSMTINGVLHHYMDSDTDSAWIGFGMGFRRAEQLQRESEKQSVHPTSEPQRDEPATD
jgi:hypothetical protein